MNDEQCRMLAIAITEISRGTVSQPLGLEALAMAIGGEGTPGTAHNVTEALHDIASGLRDVATAIAGVKKEKDGADQDFSDAI